MAAVIATSSGRSAPSFSSASEKAAVYVPSFMLPMSCMCLTWSASAGP